MPYPDYYADYPDYPDYSEGANYRPAVIEAPQPERVVQPILIERQGDQWVQVTGNSKPALPDQADSPKNAATTPQPAAIHRQMEAPKNPRELPPAILVFRDGHREEVKNYTIIGEMLYTKQNYWVSGSWSKEIDLAALDIPATLELNQSQGSGFRLPDSSHRLNSNRSPALQSPPRNSRKPS